MPKAFAFQSFFKGLSYVELLPNDIFKKGSKWEKWKITQGMLTFEFCKCPNVFHCWNKPLCIKISLESPGGFRSSRDFKWINENPLLSCEQEKFPQNMIDDSTEVNSTLVEVLKAFHKAIKSFWQLSGIFQPFEPQFMVNLKRLNEFDPFFVFRNLKIFQTLIKKLSLQLSGSLFCRKLYDGRSRHKGEISW